MKPRFIALATTVLLAGCSGTPTFDRDRSPASAEERATTVAAVARLSSFRGLLSATAEHVPAGTAPLALRPPTSLLALPTSAGATPEELLAEISARAKTVDPAELVSSAPAGPDGPSRESIEQTLASLGDQPNDRVLVVIVPGIFGEFISTHAFEEIFSREKSAYRDLWESRLAARGGNSVTDPEYSLETLGEREVPLHDLFKVSSIDDARGRPLVNAVIFETHALALESLGDIAEVSRVYSRRLTKFLDVMGSHRNVVLLGYSRGAMIELQMLADAALAPANAPWLAQTRAAVTLGGVLYGSDLADEAFNVRHANPAPTAALQMSALNQLAASLVPVKGAAPDRIQQIGTNAAAWTRFLGVLVSSTGPAPKTLLRTAREAVVHPIASFESISTKVRTQFELDVAPEINLVRKIGFHTFHMQMPFKDYNKNLRRLRTFIERATIAVAQLGTSQRLAWWRSHVLPTNGIRYYSINATLSEPRVRALDCTKPELADDCTLATSFHQIAQATGIGLNDSQVGYDKSRFWPGLERRLNSAQPPLNAVYLGLLHTHHWGLALRAVNQPKQGVTPNPFNPFPREALLESIAASVAGDLAPGAR